jgi:hypothetical protein
MKQRRSPAMDMRFYWIRNRVQQNQFHIYWRPGTKNLGDYFTNITLPRITAWRIPFIYSPHQTAANTHTATARVYCKGVSIPTYSHVNTHVQLTAKYCSAGPWTDNKHKLASMAKANAH